MRPARTIRSPEAALAGVVILAAALTLWLGRGLTFRGDEWSWLFNGTDLDADAILRAHNGHLLGLTHTVFGVLPRMVGLDDYWVFRALAVAVHSAVVVLVWLLVRRRLGPWPSVGVAALVALLGTGADAFVSAINLGFVAAVAACLAALVLLSRGTFRADLGACALLAVGLASFSLAAVFAAGVIAELLSSRGSQWRRLWVPVVPLFFYGFWWLSSAGGAGGEAGSLMDVGSNVVRAAAGAVAGVAGVQLSSETLAERAPWLEWLGVALTLILAALVVRHLVRRGATPRLANLLVAALGLWVLIAAARGEAGDLYASRYVYPGAILVALIVVELVPVDALRPRPIARALAAGLAVSLALNVGWLAVWADFLRDESVVARARLAALEVAGDRAPPEHRPTGDFALQPLTVGRYENALDEFGGSPAMSLAELRDAPVTARNAADAVLVPVAGLRLEAGGSTPERRARCVAAEPGGAPVGVAVGSSGVTLVREEAGNVAVAFRRFGDRFIPIPPVPEGRTYVLATPLGGAPDPWHLRVAATGSTTVCPTETGP